MKRLITNFINPPRNRRKGVAILSFVIVAPILVWFFLYIVFGGTYFMAQNNMTTVVNRSLDQALIKGQFSVSDQQSLIESLREMGYAEENLRINVTPQEAFDDYGDVDDPDSTYVTRGNVIEMTVVNEVVHPFYYINFGALSPERFYIGVKVSGMSEEW